MMPLKAYIEDQPRISRHFYGDMHPEDATGSVYQGSAAHISHPSSASIRMDTAFACIGKRGKSRNRYPQGEWLFYAQRRRPSRVSAHGPFNICSVWHHLCAEASVRQRLCALASYQRMLFRTAFGTDLLGEETPCQGYIQFLRFQFHPMREPSCQGEEIKNAAAVRKPLHFYF